MDTNTATKVRMRLASGESQRRIAQDLGISRYQVRQVAGRASAHPVTTTEPAIHKRAPDPDLSVTGLAGRVSRDRAGRQGLYSMIADRVLDSESNRAFGVDGRLLNPDSLKSMKVDKLVEVATSVSPEMNRALWDYLRMAVNGYEVEAFIPDTEDPDDTANAMLKQFRRNLQWNHGDESVVYRRLFISAWMRGMLIAELVMDDAGRFPVDIATPDPSQFTFKLVEDHWQIGQYQEHQWVPMDRPTFRYIALDPYPGKPEGRAPVASSLFPALFLLGLYQDLRRVIANQGYPRLDVSIDTEVLQSILDDPEKPLTVEEFDQQTSELIEIVNQNLSDVDPGGHYVHADLIQMNAPIGAIGPELANIDSIIEGLERMATRALKSTPLMMSLAEGTSEANANRQWEQWVASIDAIQKPAERLLEAIYEMSLQAQGVVADVRVRFAQIRASEAFRDAQTKRIELMNYGVMQDRGWLTPREAADGAVGFVSDAVDDAYGDAADGSAATLAGDVEETDPAEPGEPGGGESDREGYVKIQLAKEGEVNANGEIWSRSTLERAAEEHEHWTLDDDGVLWSEQRIGEMIPAVPTNVDVTDGDERSASLRFNQLEEDHENLLEARVI